MGDTYTQLYVHFVFAVYERMCLIGNSVRDEIYRYMCGIVRNREQKVIAIGGMPDHVHLLCGVKPSMRLSDLMRDVKANSSKFINERGLVRGPFRWQTGYSAFSCGRRDFRIVARYIERQQEHHMRKSFRKEYVQMLDSNKIEIDPRGLFEWIDQSPKDPPEFWIPRLEEPTPEEIRRFGWKTRAAIDAVEIASRGLRR